MIIVIPQSIGQTGKVVSVDSDGDVKIEVSGGSWTYNPLCLIPANKEKVSMLIICLCIIINQAICM